jgi:hypothetical protein
MHHPRRPAAVAALLLGLALATGASGQSQEPKPIPPGQEPTGAVVGTPAVAGAPSGTPDAAPTQPATGVTGDYTSPIWGYSLSWDPAVWAVEGEVSEEGYDGLQLGTPRSTVYLEGYAAYGGDAEACLQAAVIEVGQRDGVADVEALPGRPTPLTAAEAPQQILLRYPQTFPDGSTAEIMEFVACQELRPGVAVLETTFQTAASQYEAELPLATALLDGLVRLPTGGAA